MPMEIDQNMNISRKPNAEKLMKNEYRVISCSRSRILKQCIRTKSNQLEKLEAAKAA